MKTNKPVVCAECAHGFHKECIGQGCYCEHLGRYVDEFTFRLNQGNVARHTTERLDSFVDAIRGKRLTFSRLTA
jgi:hypothetical protein